jgi:hypothetical protein
VFLTFVAEIFIQIKDNKNRLLNLHNSLTFLREDEIVLEKQSWQSFQAITGERAANGLPEETYKMEEIIKKQQGNGHR